MNTRFKFWGKILKIRRRTQITILTERSSVVTRQNSRPETVRECPDCGRMVKMLPVGEAAKFARVNSLTIYRLVEAGQLHFAETQEGCLLVCSASLPTLESENLEIKI